MIRKIYSVILLTFVISMSSFGETVSQKQASQLAASFFNTMYGEVTPKPKLVWNGRELTTDRLFSPMYVYNNPRGGFVVISADNKALPILAYSKTERFDKSQLGYVEKAQFQRFAREVELIRYDTRTPERAIKAWQNIPQYFTDMLSNPYNTDEFRRLTDEAKEEIETMDRRNSWIIMPSAVEFDIYNPNQYRDYNLDDVLAVESENIEIPFKFYEDFLSDIDEENRSRTAAFDEILFPSEPKVRSEGGGTYSIFMPYDETARLMRVYDVTGRRMLENTYPSSPMVHLEMFGLGSGYYIVMVLTDSGNIYAFKLAR